MFHQSKEALDSATAGVSAAAIFSPFWLPWLEAASELAAILAPLLGVIWLLVQIWAKIHDTLNKGAPNGRDE